MQENIKGLYAAFKAKDARFDGRFFRWHIVYGDLLPPGLQSQTAQSGELYFFLERPQLRNRPATGPVFCAGRNLLPVPLLLMLRLI